MSFVIHKLAIPAELKFILQVPESAEILNVQMQGEKAVLWYMFDQDEGELFDREFSVIPTGYDFEEPAGVELVYINTFQPQAGLVFHLFEHVLIPDDEEEEENDDTQLEPEH
jgi:hypothetical protein